MFRAGELSYVGGLALLGIMLIITTVLGWLGLTFGEALYVSTLGLVGVSYGVTEWRLRREK